MVVMHAYEVDPIDASMEYDEVVDVILAQVDSKVAERPELRDVLLPEQGARQQEAEMRAACQNVLQLFDDAGDRLPEKYFLESSELLKRLFLYAEPRESLARIKFVARALHAVFQATSNMSAEMAREISALKAKETAHELEAQKLRNLVSQLRSAREKDAQRIQRLVRLGEQAAESRVFLEMQCDALRRKRKLA
jgi:hypothetical protein